MVAPAWFGPALAAGLQQARAKEVFESNRTIRVTGFMSVVSAAAYGALTPAGVLLHALPPTGWKYLVSFWLVFSPPKQ